jgi:hypothetical protein
MLDEIVAMPEDPEELRAFTARLLAEVKAQAILIEKLRHRLAGHRAHRFGASSETAEQLQLALETSEIAAAAMTARLRLPEVEEKGQPKRRPIPEHIPRMEVELSPATDACAGCGGKLRRIGEDVTEELEYIPGRFIVIPRLPDFPSLWLTRLRISILDREWSVVAFCVLRSVDVWRRWSGARASGMVWRGGPMRCCCSTTG